MLAETLDAVAAAGKPLLAWLLTYALHSSGLIAAALLVTRLRRLDDRTRETLLKVALLGGILSSTLQLGLARPFAVWQLELPALERASSASSPVSVVAPAAPVSPVAPRVPLVPTAIWWLAPWLAGLAWAAVVQICARRRLAHVLDGQRLVTEPRLRGMLARACERADLSHRVALMQSPALAAPVAYGFARPRIVLPERALAELEDAQLESMVAHEVAHLAHRDPLWLTLCHVLETIFFFQPLNRVARRRLQELAEYRCDEFAAERSGQGLALASCLVLVAQWIKSARIEQALVPAMAAGDSSLSRRVARLLAEPPAAGRSRAAVASAALLASAFVMLLALAAPGFSAWQSGTPASPTRAAGVDEALELLDTELLALDDELAQLAQEITSAADPAPVAARVRELAGRVRQLQQMRAPLNIWTQDPTDLSLPQTISRRPNP
jgi:beta-lactamase regulating signal transducer with metallopeptidase domain